MSEEKIKLTEDQITEALQQQAESVQKEKPEDMAAAFFSLQQPRFKFTVDQLSQRQLKRLIFQLVSHPFTPSQYQPSSQLEKDAFYLGNEMIHNRMLMQLSYEMQKAEEAQQKLNEEANNLIKGTNEETGETKNEV